jgi:hypothetical protein
MESRIAALRAAFAALSAAAFSEDRKISAAEYRDKVYGAWIGQIAGVSYGFNFADS